MAIFAKPTLTQTFLERAKRDADRVGFSYKPTYPEDGPIGHWKDVTYRQFHDRVRDLSYGLRALGVGRGDRVAILSNSRFEWSLCDISILSTGAVTVPVYPSSTEKDAAYILDHSEAKVAIVEDSRQLEKLLSTRPASVTKIVVIEPAARPPESDALSLAQLAELGRAEAAADPHLFEREIERSQPGDLITICYTSGTTGVPKGAMLTHDNVMSVLEDAVAVFSKHVDPEKDAVLSFLPFSHILGRVESMAVYVFGWKQFFAESLDKLMINIEQTEPTLIFAVPRVFEKAYSRIQTALTEGQADGPKPGAFKQKLVARALVAGREYHHARKLKRKPAVRVSLEHALYDRLVFAKLRARFGSRFRYALCGGAPLPKEIGEFFQIAGIQILEGYGLTETTGPVTLNTPEDARYGTVGRPLPEVSVKVAGDGELLLKSRKVFKGYYKAPSETGDALEEGWFKTGDIGFVDGDGFVHITDRKKDILVTSAGKNVAPQKIENLAKTHKFISQFVVHGDRRHFLSALITLERDQVIKYANEQQILFSAYGELVNHPKIHALVQRAIDDVNTHLAQYETIKRFVVLPEDFTVEGGELTPSLKVKRRFVDQKYRSALDSMYGP